MTLSAPPAFIHMLFISPLHHERSEAIVSGDQCNPQAARAAACYGGPGTATRHSGFVWAGAPLIVSKVTHLKALQAAEHSLVPPAGSWGESEWGEEEENVRAAGIAESHDYSAPRAFQSHRRSDWRQTMLSRFISTSVKDLLREKKQHRTIKKPQPPAEGKAWRGNTSDHIELLTEQRMSLLPAVPLTSRRGSSELVPIDYHV